MRVSVELTRDVAAALHGRRELTADSRSLIDLTDRLGVALEAQHGDSSEPSLLPHFSVEAGDADSAERVAAALRAHSGVDAAYVKPPASPP